MKRTAAVVPSVVALAVIGVVCAAHADDLGHALDRVELWVFALATGVHVLVVTLRTEAWRVTLTAIGRTPGPRAAHWASAIGFTAGILEGHAALPARMAAARRVAPETTPPLAEMLLSDLPVYALEACLITALLPLAVAGGTGFPAWSAVAIGVAAPAVVLALRLLHQRFESHRLAAGLAVLAQPGLRRRLLALAAILVALTFARVWVVIWAVGLPASAGDAAVVYIAVTLVGQLPIGPAVGPAATLAVASGGGVAAAAAAGLVISTTSVAAVLVYLACAAVLRPPRPAVIRPPSAG